MIIFQLSVRTCGSSDDEKDIKVAMRKEKDGSRKIDFTGEKSETSGLAGFPKRDESVNDAFGVGHSSTSKSAGPGMTVGRDLLGKKNYVIAVIRNGAMTAGQVYEATNNCGFLDYILIIILNNNQVSLPTAIVDGPTNPVGTLSSSLAKLQASTKFHQLQEVAKIGWQAHKVAAKLDEYAWGMVNPSGSTLFEELSIYYIGPANGHSVQSIISILGKIKDFPAPEPVIIHTAMEKEKGKGYPFAEAVANKMHGVSPFDVKTGKLVKFKATTLPYFKYFANYLIKEAEADIKIIAIHAAISGGTGLNIFEKQFSSIYFDVKIAEQHAVTFTTGLPTQNMKPFCDIYSTFLQRAYDQVMHDVDLQMLPVQFARTMDRAELVGADGPTHCGAFNVTYKACLPNYMTCLPNMVVMTPADEAELIHMVATAAQIDDRSSCVKYPRGNGIGVPLPPYSKGIPMEIGKERLMIEGERIAILGYSTMVQGNVAQRAWVTVTVVDGRFYKPLDTELVRMLAANHEILITIKEGFVGGFGSHVTNYSFISGLLDGNLKVYRSWRTR